VEILLLEVDMVQMIVMEMDQHGQELHMDLGDLVEEIKELLVLMDFV
jgi:hypothetical protein